MNNIMIRSFIFLLFILSSSCSTPGGGDNTIILMKTTLGDIKLKLYDGTPLHRDNFLDLVKSNAYDGVSFHRVINNFMIQSGDLSTRTTSMSAKADTLKDYTIPAEINDLYFHKKGALAAAREGNDINPLMRSSGTQFYIVQGVRITDDELVLTEKQISSGIKQALFNKFLHEVSDSARKTGTLISDAEVQEKASVKMFDYLSNNEDYNMTEERRQVYKTLGGVPRLDGTYTVFGEVIEGLDVVDKIAVVPTDNSDKPVSDIRILKMKIIN